MDTNSKKVYYAHCISIYDTAQERRDVHALESLGFEVINPNLEECDDGYAKEGMRFFLRFAEECDVIAFRAVPGGRIPAGVAQEIEMFQALGKVVIELPSGIPQRSMPVTETRGYLMEVGFR